MYIAIDDTYGGGDTTSSRYVTSNRRTHVAVIFEDHQVEEIRENIEICLHSIKARFSINVDEFHFTDIYNRSGGWSQIKDDSNLDVIEFFAEIYCNYRWKILVQTVDDRTRKDHSIPKEFDELAKTLKLNLKNNSHLSLFYLILKIRLINNIRLENLRIFMDEGLGKSGSIFAAPFFKDFGSRYQGRYASSKEEPLLQIADFLAFMINRMTYLGLKKNRTEIDKWFLELCGRMSFNSDDLVQVRLVENFTIDDFDYQHKKDRVKKGLE